VRLTVTPTVTDAGVAEWHRKHDTAIYRFAKVLVGGGKDAPGGTRTHDLTPKTNPNTTGVRRISPGETAGDTPNLHPKRAQSRNRNRNGAVTGGGAA
jgi:hypothetical protein